MILVSACLLGANCKYNGGNNLVSELAELLTGREIKLFCPETAGGLPVPRPPAEITGGDGFDVLAGRARVETGEDRDVTGAFLKGAEQAVSGLAPGRIDFAILKEKSPSCGSSQIYNGDFAGKLRPGPGVTAALLQKWGIEVFSEKELTRIKEKLQIEEYG